MLDKTSTRGQTLHFSTGGMSSLELVRFAVGAIMAHPMRSALTSLGVVIGVAAVIMMTSIGVGAQQRVEQALSSLGTNMLVVRPGAPRSGGGGGFVRGAGGSGASLTVDDAEAMRTLDGVAAISPAINGGAQLVYEGANWSSRIEGVTPDYLVARDLEIASGQIPQRMRQFLIAVGVLLLAGAGQAASAPSPIPTVSGVLAGLAALCLGAVMAFCGAHFALRRG